MNLFELTKALIDIPSITGEESKVAAFLADYLSKCGFKVGKQSVEANRFNVVATTEKPPRVVFCTHTDTVPPFVPCKEDESHIHGRGACDAKGILAAMVHAGLRLLDEDVHEFGFLFVVGEETDSQGARVANGLPLSSDYIVVGEPTENKLGVGHKGLVAIRLSASGRAAHSAFPELGDSAIDKLLLTLQRIRSADFGQDAVLGTSTVNIGTVAGGVAHNVIPDRASATISIRNTVPASEVVERLQPMIDGSVELEVLSQSEPQKLYTLSDYEQTVLPFGTDIPHLTNFGKPLLIGPGTATLAHTAEERIEKQELSQAVELYVDLAKRLLSS